MKKQQHQETMEAHMRESYVLDATQKGTTPKHAQVSLAYVISRDPFWVEMLGCCPTSFSTTPVH